MFVLNTDGFKSGPQSIYKRVTPLSNHLKTHPPNHQRLHENGVHNSLAAIWANILQVLLFDIALLDIQCLEFSGIY